MTVSIGGGLLGDSSVLPFFFSNALIIKAVKLD